MSRRPVVPALHLLAAMAAGLGCSGQIRGQDDVAREGGGGTSGSSSSGGSGNSNNPPTSGKPAESACSGVARAGAPRWRRLTKPQYVNTVRDLLNVTPDASALTDDTHTGAFRTNSSLPVQENDVSTYATLAASTASKAVANLNTLVGCDAAVTGGQDKCAAEFVKSFGSRAFRRPLAADEESALLELYKVGKQESFSSGIRTVVEAVLQAPNFLYMVEWGQADAGGARKLTGYEVATRLSYMMTATTPDAALMTAAREGKLDTADGVRSYAEKLMASSRFASVGDFATQLLGVDVLTDGAVVSKAAKYTTFDVAMRTSMRDEPQKFADYVMNKGGGSIAELLSGGYVFPSGPLASVYGTKPDADGRAVVSDGTRKGILTLAGSVAAHPRQPSPHAVVNRGHFVRQEFLCQNVPPPDQAINFELPPGAEKMTSQQLLRAHLENPTCKGCHTLMDPIGFGFESYDPIGAYRTKDDAGNTVDSSGEVVGIAGDGRFANAGKMAEVLAHSPEVRSCMTSQWFRYAVGRDAVDADTCTQELVGKALSAGAGDIKQALLALVGSDSFRFNGGL